MRRTSGGLEHGCDQERENSLQNWRNSYVEFNVRKYPPARQHRSSANSKRRTPGLGQIDPEAVRQPVV